MMRWLVVGTLALVPLALTLAGIYGFLHDLPLWGVPFLIAAVTLVGLHDTGIKSTTAS